VPFEVIHMVEMDCDTGDRALCADQTQAHGDCRQKGAVLRLATPEDEGVLLRWRNHPALVRLGSSQRNVTADEHAAWFEQQLTSADSLLLIAEAGGTTIGQARFARSGDAATISTYLVPGLEGRGLGVPLIARACHHAFNEWPIEWIIACVRLGNGRALRAFERAGFERLSERAECPPDHVRLARLRPRTGEPE
jgi:RimJ/RimL family protein N-acetyltransferase